MIIQDLRQKQGTGLVGSGKMCIICIDIEKDKLTLKEARRNFGEMSNSLGDHAAEVEEMLSKLEIEESLKEYLEYLEEEKHNEPID